MSNWSRSSLTASLVLLVIGLVAGPVTPTLGQSR